MDLYYATGYGVTILIFLLLNLYNRTYEDWTRDKAKREGICAQCNVGRWCCECDPFVPPKKGR